jgi:hypothetical protein
MMNRKALLTALVALPLAVGDLVFGQMAQRQAEKPQQINAATFTCPLTGEELPCPNCCPLKQRS